RTRNWCPSQCGAAALRRTPIIASAALGEADLPAPTIRPPHGTASLMSPGAATAGPGPLQRPGGLHTRFGEADIMNTALLNHPDDSHQGIEGHVDRAPDDRLVDMRGTDIALERSECVRSITDRYEVRRPKIDDSDSPGSRRHPGEPEAGQGDDEHQHPKRV